MLYFEWDEQKAVANLAKHGVSFETAAHVFNDPFAVDGVPRNQKAYRGTWQWIAADRHLHGAQ